MQFSPGLDGVIAAETALCSIDGEAGRLVVCGHEIDALVAAHDFAGVCALLWGSERDEVAEGLGLGRARAFAGLGALGRALDLPDSMDAMRAALGQHSVAAEAAVTRVELAAALPVYAAAWARRRQGLDPIAPDPAAGHAHDYLRMLDDAPPDEARAKALDAYGVTLSEHDVMTSTFAARVIVSTGADEVSAVVGALGALKGPAHGGAPAPILAMIESVEKPEAARDWVRTQLEAGGRIMGMGHRVYRTRDPRAGVIEGVLEGLVEAGMSRRKLDVARGIENAAAAAFEERRPGRAMRANVELYAAVLLDALGLPRDLFTPTYAAACIASWLAHAKEQQETGRMIRPSSQYVGP